MVVDTIFFDLDDTLVLTSDHDKPSFAAACALATERKPAIDDVAMLAAFKKRFSATPWDPDYKVEVTQWRANLWNEAMQEQGLADPDLALEIQKCFDRTRMGIFTWVEGVPEMIAQLKAANYKMCIITNGHHKVQHDKLDACKAADIFEHIIVGGDEVLEGKPEKPAASIFHKACQMVRCNPENAIHVGDSLSSDIQGAINANLAGSVWVNRKNAQAPDAPMPTYTVQVVTELPEVLAKLRE